ncbi:diguanylate cyclase [Frateuria sp. GZRR33]|uniref:GGDEF domain-containing protein n=1 Tax=Frateuria sp. GZRR33 TaxID=3351535 RepID=UPI003EDBCA05
MDAPARLITLHGLPATLAASCRIPPECRTHVEAVVRLRAVAFARLLVPLTLAWIPLDVLALGPARALPALVLRLALAGGLLALSCQAARLPRFTAMWLLVALQAVGFGLLQWRVPPHDDALRIGYGLFPYLMAAQLALFPLPWWRNLLAAVAAAGQFALLLALEGAPADALLWNRVWLFGLIVAVGAWTGQAQLRLLVRLLAARRDAAHDPLTGLANRRHATAHLQAACADADRRGEPLSVLMLDLDHFKRVNDQHGHAGGDCVLVALAQVLRRELRASDLAARHGGEEFLAVLPACDGTDALATAERIRLAVAAMHVPVPDGEARATLSVGLATRDTGEAPEALIARADAALYRAKAQGRNRCVVG